MAKIVLEKIAHTLGLQFRINKQVNFELDL